MQRGQDDGDGRHLLLGRPQVEDATERRSRPDQYREARQPEGLTERCHVPARVRQQQEDHRGTAQAKSTARTESTGTVAARATPGARSGPPNCPRNVTTVKWIRLDSRPPVKSTMPQQAAETSARRAPVPRGAPQATPDPCGYFVVRVE
ncbi:MULTISPECIES: hypothetical protein [Streptomyces]|uniref:hypothetical protein n=1 Tax=Streptomyces TaxID=1883 RepID=UPI00123B300F|nr:MULTISPECIES: hypothetical protein [Streptomyces]NEA00208.1 hypothetical protein [Streptomyces sp. SID10116]MYY82521.1 hypothetical protein [Streptomyces sp. SID335]MYZ19446.1 hypothetical protein [Streptomyces sp. SID337]NDZ85466.1 hypothetical protein [Streptomyces sp. SID10115]NEB48816.1 hypothetical protein [Streptomyces sp. SID339]